MARQVRLIFLHAFGHVSLYLLRCGKWIRGFVGDVWGLVRAVDASYIG